jgi:phytoene desaturase
VSRVIVVGGGVGGLAVAARLARLRHQVTLLERSDRTGGKLGVYSREGFTFDTGPSLVTLPATLRDLFLKTGRPLEEVVQLRALDVLAHYRFPDGVEMDVPNSGIRGVAAAFQDALGGTAGRDWTRFHDDAERTWEAVRGPFVESPLAGAAGLTKLALRRPRDLARVQPWRTLRDVGRRAFRDDRQRLFLDRYATYTGSDPRRAPAVLRVIPYVEHTFRGWYVDGGLRAIGDAIATRAVQRGVEIRTGATVTRVTTDASGRVDGVQLADESRLPADIVVSDVDAAVLYDELLPLPAQQRRLRRVDPSLSGFVLLLALRGCSTDLRHHTVLFGADYDAEMDAVFGSPATAPDDPTLYVACSPDGAPPGHEAWFVLANAPRHGAGPGAIDWEVPGVATSYAGRLLALLAARGLDVRDRIVFAEHRTPADLERATASPGGAIYGASSNSARAAFLRPRNASPVPGLFLVGGSTHPGGGLPMVLMSAAITAELIGRG